MKIVFFRPSFGVVDIVETTQLSGLYNIDNAKTWSEEHNLHMTGIEEKLGVIIGYWDELDAKGKDPNILPKRK